MKKLYYKYEEIIKYIIIGGCTTVVSLLTYYLLTLTILDPNNPIKLQLANIISWIASVTFAFFTNKFIVFKKKNKVTLKEITSFYLARLSTLLLDMGLMYIFVSVLGFNDKIIKLIVQVILIITNYLLSKFIVFKKEA